MNFTKQDIVKSRVNETFIASLTRAVLTAKISAEPTNNTNVVNIRLNALYAESSNPINRFTATKMPQIVITLCFMSTMIKY